jgi:hypothetical protein
MNKIIKIGNNTSRKVREVFCVKSLYSVKKVAMVCSVVLVAAFGIGYLVTYERNPDGMQRPDAAETVDESTRRDIGDDTVADYVSKPKTTAVTRLIFKSYYSQCGHTVVERREIPAPMVGLSEDSILEHYPGWEVEKFEADEIALYRQVAGACPGHFILKEENGYIAIYETVDGGRELLIDITDIPVSILRLRDQQRLRQGMLLDSMEEVNRYLEDLGS